MSDEMVLPTEGRQCPYPGCTVEVLDGTGAACCPEHKEWFDKQIADSNAGIPPLFETDVSETSASIVGGTLDY